MTGQIPAFCCLDTLCSPEPCLKTGWLFRILLILMDLKRVLKMMKNATGMSWSLPCSKLYGLSEDWLSFQAELWREPLIFFLEIFSEEIPGFPCLTSLPWRYLKIAKNIPLLASQGIESLKMKRRIASEPVLLRGEMLFVFQHKNNAELAA